MVICCAAPNCTNRQGKGQRGAISFHRFPLKDSARLYLWTAAIQRSDWTPGPYSFLCSEHFSEDSFVPRMPDQHPLLRPDAVPSLFRGGKEVNRKGTYEPQILCLGKRKQLRKKISPYSQEDKRLLVSPNGDFGDKIDASNNADTWDNGCRLRRGSHHIASKFIFSLHSYSRSSATPISQNSDSSPHQLEEETNHPHDLHLEEKDRQSPSPEYVCEDILFSVGGCARSFGTNDSVMASIASVPPQVCGSEVLQSPAYGVQETIPGIQTKYPSHDTGSEVLDNFDSPHSDCSIEKTPTRFTNQCSNQEHADRYRGEEPGSDLLGHNAQGSPPLNPAVAPLAWMLGTWRSDPPGEGEFPSIPCFRYMEEAVISHVGQPMLNFTFCSSNPETGKPMHRECGFIRVKPGTNHVAFICAQNFGVVEVEEGEVEGEQLTLTSQSVSRISFAKEPYVQQISRTFRLTAEGKMEQTVSMATSTQVMAPHLRVTYKKVTS
ncbi:peroxynitrite isomerase THAP4 isoform X2 [Dendrobates tinctorius]|uniref:peroxynitrite isomerase THAP4 isoform X2 n=1 Tax=Dendrobates tinctorius TaxID=92724 RepID=UPI003CC95A2A